MMRALLCCAALLALPMAFAMDDPTVSLPGVVDLTPDNFDKFVNGAKHALVEFYAPWCGHCKRMTGEYKKLGEMVTADGKLNSRVVIGKVDADAHRELGQRFGVGGFPTIKWFSRGKPINKDNAKNYEGGRTADKFLEYITARLEEDKGFARVEALDALAKKFAAAAKGDLAKVLKETEAAAGKLKGDAAENGKLYLAVMKKAQDKGTEWLAKEQARLERMISSGSVAASKVEEMARKSSVLSAFVATKEQ